jgi:HAD superfamily hydrolase (TIGR01509 family)
LLVNALFRETGHDITSHDARQLQSWHLEAYAKLVDQVRPLPGAVELLAHLSAEKVKYAIATSGMLAGARPALEMLKVRKTVPVITRDQVKHAKPDPDLFLAAAERLGVSIQNSIVVGDSVWDLLAARRARALGVGLASGGYGREELERAGAYRTYDDPRDLMEHLDEIGVRTRSG